MFFSVPGLWLAEEDTFGVVDFSLFFGKLEKLADAAPVVIAARTIGFRGASLRGCFEVGPESPQAVP